MHDSATSIREVFSYLKRFRNSLFVLKIEDSLLEHSLFPLLMKDLVQLHEVGIKILIVPGTRVTIAKYLKQFQVESPVKDGLRITSKEAMPLVEMAAMEVTQAFLNHLSARGANGLTGNWVKARSMGVHKGIDYGSTGLIEKVKSGILDKLMDDDFIPIIPSIGWNSLGDMYNVSSNQVAVQVCKDLDVIKLFFVGDESGISAKGLDLPEGMEVTPKGIIPSMNLEESAKFLEKNQGQLNWQVRDYLSSSREAIKGGTNRIHLVPGRVQGSILQEVFSSRGDGTMVYANAYSSVRAARGQDIPHMLHLMKDYIAEEILVPRSEQQLLEQLDDYLVYEVDQGIHGCGALHDLEENTAEIASIAVDQNTRRRGVGRQLVAQLLEKARKRKRSRVVLLTTRAADWFLEQGFREGTLEDLPEKRRKSYSTKRNSRIIVLEL